GSPAARLPGADRRPRQGGIPSPFQNRLIVVEDKCDSWLCAQGHSVDWLEVRMSKRPVRAGYARTDLSLSPIPRLTILKPLPGMPPELLPWPRWESALSSACPAPAGNRTGDPARRTPPPASPQTSCANGSAPASAGTSTGARSGLGSASTSATAPAQTPGAAAASPLPPARRNTGPAPCTTQSVPPPGALPAASAAGSRTARR